MALRVARKVLIDLTIIDNFLSILINVYFAILVYRVLDKVKCVNKNTVFTIFFF